jgi:hypothetical protein
MFYMDPSTFMPAGDPKGIQYRLSVKACMPMYMAPGMDISDAVVEIMNKKLRGTAAAAPAPGAVASQPTAGAAPRP